MSFLESGKDLDFEIKRLYYTYRVPAGVKRGGHAHRRLSQVLICPVGSIEVILDDGSEIRKVVLDDPTMGLIVPAMIWHDMVWLDPGSLLLVAASDYYDEADYIRDYKVFKGCACAKEEQS